VADNEDLELDELTAENAGDTANMDPDAEGGENADTSNMDMPSDDSEISRTAADLEAVFDIPVHVSAVLGKSRMQVSQLLKLGRGAVVELDRKVGEAIDIYVNNRLVARGEVVVVEDRLGVTMTEIIKSDRR
jgi:flagellar motor switch protein FliN/FliY